MNRTQTLLSKLAKLTFRYYQVTLVIRHRGKYIAATLRKLQEETKTVCKELQQMEDFTLEEFPGIKEEVDIIANE